MTRVKAIPLIAIAFAIALSASLAACDVPSAQGAPPPKDLAIAPVADCPAGSLCFSSRWTGVSDSYGAADSYRVRIVAPGVSIDTTVVAKSFAFRIPCSPGASGSITADVWSVRRGKESASSKRATAAYACPDPAPPAPDSVIIAPDSAVNPNPPAGDTGSDSLPSPAGSVVFDVPAPQSPHFTDKRRTLSDMCYCDAWKDKAARAFDGILSGSTSAWLAINPTIQQDPYILLASTLDEANKDAPSLTGKFQDDMRRWFAEHPEYDYELAWLHRADSADTTPADSAHRLHPFIWTSSRFFGNPADPGWRAYTLDRFRRSRAQRPGSTGLFLDEMDPNNLGWIGKSREFAGKPASVWQDAIIDQVRELRAALGVRLQINAATYSLKDFPVRLGIASGSMHLETLNRATQEMPPVWTLVDSLIRHDVYIDLVNLESWHDFHGGSSKLSNPAYYPAGGYYAEPVYRAKVLQFASYLMVVPPNEQMVGIMDNAVRASFGLSPDSVDLRVYYLHVGEPKGPRTTWLDTRDGLSQRARVYRRDFESATVLIRPVAYWADTVFRDTTGVPVPLPEGGPWSYVTARGNTVPLDSLRLRNSEAVILVRRE